MHRFSRRDLASLLGGGLIAWGAASASLAQEAAEPIDQTAFVPIGGIDQWISIQGQDRRNPVLLVVHGGPGEAQWPVAYKYKPWEKAFTVVLWDQRGAGHTYGRYGAKTPDMTLDRFCKDGVELADYLCRTLGKRKIIVLGHSWGTLVAVGMVQRRPDLFAAYVGTGQVSSWKADVNAQFDLLLAKARADGDAATIKQFEAIGRPDPLNTRQYFTFSKNLMAVEAPSDRAWIKDLRSGLPAAMKADPQNYQDFLNGFEFSAEHVLPDQIVADLPTTASRINTAFFVIQGRDDVITPTRAAVAYFNLVKAPKKQLVLIPNAGHFAFMTASDAFLAALVDDVRPAAIARGA
jgi:pimeloyl-ACP methyl ester carboxylesterase